MTGIIRINALTQIRGRRVSTVLSRRSFMIFTFLINFSFSLLLLSSVGFRLIFFFC